MNPTQQEQLTEEENLKQEIFERVRDRKKQEQLPPCPFCRGTIFTMQYESWGPNKVRCLTCGAEGPDKLGEDLAREAWSRRSHTEQAQARLTEREQWLLADVSSIGRTKIDASQYDELRVTARRLAGLRITPLLAASSAPEDETCPNHCGHDPMTFTFDGACSRYVPDESTVTGWRTCRHRCEFSRPAPDESSAQHPLGVLDPIEDVVGRIWQLTAGSRDGWSRLELRGLVEQLMMKSHAPRPVSEAAERSCAICGGARVAIRGRYPTEKKRVVCPTCLADRMDEIRATSSMEYGAASNIETELTKE